MSEIDFSQLKTIQPASTPDVFSLDPLLQRAIKNIPVDSRYVIALSGGLDSMALLHFTLSCLQDRAANIVVLHVHHGLNAAADRWAEYCQQVCQSLSLECCIEKVRVKPSGEGLEAAAREARYQVFERYLTDGGTLLQGHHQNDQAETVLMRLMRGSGPEGLAGIPQQRALSAGQLFRPWLGVPRALLLQQVEQFQLGWIEDDSNSDLKYDRNFIRHQLIPLLLTRWPATLDSLSRVSERATQAHQQISGWASGRLGALLSPRYLQDQALMLAPLREYSAYEQRILLREWLDFQGLAHPSDATFERIWSELIPARHDAQPELRWGGNCLRRYQGCVFCLSVELLNQENPEYCYTLALPEEGVSQQLDFGPTSLKLALSSTDDLVLTGAMLLRLPDPDETLVLRTRTGGESMRLPGSGGTRSLKKILQERGVPPWCRQSLPLIYYGENLVCVADVVIADGCAASADQPALVVTIDR